MNLRFAILFLLSFTELFSTETLEFFAPRRANIAQALEIAEVVNAAFAKGDIFRKPGQRRTSQEQVEEDFRAGRTWYIIEYGDDLSRKIAAAVLYTPESETVASLHMLSSHPDHFGKKKGTELLLYVEKQARIEQKHFLSLSVADINERLIKHYESLSFQQTGMGEYLPPHLQQEYLKEDWQGYEGAQAKLKRINMSKLLCGV